MSLKGPLGTNGAEGGVGVKCFVCKHKDHVDINMELAAGATIQYVAVKYGIALQSVERHKRNHLMKPTEQGLSVINLQDVMSIPINMAERSQLIRALIDRLLETLTSQGKYSGVHFVEWSPLIRLLRLQQIDEQTILKITGVIREGDATPEVVTTRQYDAVRELIDKTMLELSQGSGVIAEEAKQVLADRLLPMDELIRMPGAAQVDPITYADLGTVDE